MINLSDHGHPYLNLTSPIKSPPCTVSAHPESKVIIRYITITTTSARHFATPSSSCPPRDLFPHPKIRVRFAPSLCRQICPRYTRPCPNPPSIWFRFWGCTAVWATCGIYSSRLGWASTPCATPPGWNRDFPRGRCNSRHPAVWDLVGHILGWWRADLIP